VASFFLFGDRDNAETRRGAEEETKDEGLPVQSMATTRGGGAGPRVVTKCKSETGRHWSARRSGLVGGGGDA